jgi:hypothetical protein
MMLRRCLQSKRWLLATKTLSTLPLLPTTGRAFTSSVAAPFSATAAAGQSAQSFTSHHHHLPPPLTDYSLDTRSPAFQQAMERTNSQVAELEERLATVRQIAGGETAVARHVQRGKLLARDRIEQLVDPGTPVLELSALAGCNDDIASGGIVTSIGIIAGQPCMMIANDATVKGGTCTC